MLAPEKVQAAVKDGLAFVCATCDHYWRAQGVGQEQCSPGGDCAGPMGGDTFGRYAGPLTVFIRWCFVCGEKATKGIKVGTSLRVLGCCDAHVDTVRRIRPEGRGPTGRALIGVDASGREYDVLGARETTSKLTLKVVR